VLCCAVLCRELFDALDRCESILGGSRYLVGNALTEADVRLFMTLVRFDHVSLAVGHAWGLCGVKAPVVCVCGATAAVVLVGCTAHT
jgi:glutathione S-transferase